MASDFVRKVKGIRNIDILSPNITTENDLISTIDGEVYVATNKGYRKITGVETKEIKQLKTDVSNVKIQSDTNTLNISDNTDDIETNTSEIETLKTSTDNNTSEIETLKTSTGNNTSVIETLKTSIDNTTSEIETLKTSTDNNTSVIETLKTSTDNNTSEIETLKTSTETNKTKIEDIEINVNNLTETINKLNEYIEVKTFNDIDLMDKDSLNTLPLGVNYVAGAKNKTPEMTTSSGWLTVHYANNVKRLLFQPFSDGRTYYNFIYKDVLEEWK